MASSAGKRTPVTPVAGSGRVARDLTGLELIVERSLPLPGAQTWSWLTAPRRLGKWLGAVTGTRELGSTVQLTMAFPKDAAAEPFRIVDCQPHRRLSGVLGVGADAHPLSVSLAELDAATVVYLSLRLTAARDVGLWGPVWEYSLDRLLAAQSGTAMPSFAAYATQRPYYERLAMDGEPQGWPEL